VKKEPIPVAENSECLLHFKAHGALLIVACKQKSKKQKTVFVLTQILHFV